MKAGSDGALVADPAPSDPAAYRLPVVTNALLPTDQVTADEADAIKRFVTYAVGAGQATGTLPRGYVPLTDEQSKQALAAADSLKGAPASTPTPTSSSSAKPATGGSSSSSGSTSGGSGIGSLGGSDEIGSGGAGGTGADGGAANAAPAPPGTAAVAAGTPNRMTSVFERTGLDRPGSDPLVLPLLALLAAAGFIVGPKLLRSAGPKAGKN